MTARPITLRRVLARARWAAILGLLTWVVGSLGWTMLRARAGDPHAQFDDPWHRGHRVLDRHGALLRELPSDAGRRGRPLPLDEIGDRLIVTTLVSEDREFYEHDGIDHAALARAMKQNVAHARLVSGASTVTQQLVKMLDTEGEPGARTLGGKLVEMARAQNLEQSADKSEILAQYLNRLPYGHGLVGPEAAAQGYFGVAAKDLSWAQAAYLAVLPRAPSFLDPYRHPERVRLRQAALIEALHETGYLSVRERDRALTESLEAHPLRRPFHAPHLIETLRLDGALTDGDLTHTTLDLRLQADVEGMVSTHLAALDQQVAPGGADDAAVLVIDNASGEVLAYVGSADFHDPEIAGQVDMVRALRQPGSSLKPFVYALAFAEGYTGPQMLADVPTRFVEGGGEYDPRNFHRGFEGPISAREALASSLNVPAVRLTAELGVPALLDLLHRLGLESLDQDAEHYGVALALGSGEVRLWDLAGAYVALARGGERVELRARVGDRSELGQARPGTRVIEPEVAAAVSEALSDPLARARLLAGRSPFDLGFPVAVKTGTSSGYRDTWAVGYTAERTVAVWLGNADGAPTHELTGASGAGPLFGDVMRRAMREVPTRAPLWDAESLTTVEVCPLSGLPAGPACPDRVRHRFARGHAPDEPCQVHRHARRTHDGLVCDEDGHEVVAVFPDAFAGWLEAQPSGAPGRSPHGIEWHPAAALPGCTESARQAPALLRIEQPLTGTAFLAEEDGEAIVQVHARLEGAEYRVSRSMRSVEILVDGRVVARTADPFVETISLPRGDHELSVRPSDHRLPIRSVAARVSVR